MCVKRVILQKWDTDSTMKVTIRGLLGVVSSPKWSESERLEGEEAAWVSGKQCVQSRLGWPWWVSVLV